MGVLLFLTASVARAQTDADWQDSFGYGTNDEVEAIVEGPDGNVYVGGRFTYAGNLEVPRLAMWDGIQWHDVGGVQNADGSDAFVFALALDDDTPADGDTLYVGGHFNEVVRADGTTMAASNIAALDLSTNTWSVLADVGTQAEGVTGYSVATMALDDARLYVGGGFSEAGGGSADNVAFWDRNSETWGALGTDDCNGTTSGVSALAVDAASGALYLGGSFVEVRESYMDAGVLQCRNKVVNGVARRDGGGWFALGGGVHESLDPGIVRALEIDAPSGDLYVGGRFRWAYDDLAGSNSVESSNLARWDGSQWHAVGEGTQSPQYAEVNTLLLDGTDLYVGGSFQRVFNADGTVVNAYGLALWNGTEWPSQLDSDSEQWSVLGSGAYYESFDETGFGTGDVKALALAGGDVLIGGDFSELYRDPDFKQRRRVFNIGRWDGSDYYPFGTGLDGPVAAAASDGDVVYLAGDFQYLMTPTGAVNLNHTAQYDPATGAFSALGGGIDNECDEYDPSDCDLKINAAVVDPASGNLYVGIETSASSADVFLRWDGTAWTGLGITSGADGYGSYPKVNDLLVDGEHVYVAGSFREGVYGDDGVYTGTTQYGLVRWDTAQEQFEKVSSAYDTPYLASYGALGQEGGYLYFVTGFRELLHMDQATGSVTDTTSFNGGGQLESLVALGGRLYAAGGNFSEVTYHDAQGTPVTVAANGVAAYDPGTGTWSALGSGLQQQGNAASATVMTAHGGKLYVGSDTRGGFDQAGDQPASFLAAWDPAAQAWSALGSGLPDVPGWEVLALASAGDHVYVGGVFGRLGNGQWSPHLAGWYDPVSASTGTHTFAAGDPLAYDFPGLSLRLDFTSLDQDATVTVERSFGVPSPLPPGRELALGGSWTVEQTGASSFSADVCFDLGDLTHPQGDIDFSQLEVHKRESASDPWQALAIELRPDASSPQRICGIGVTGFSEFVVAAVPSALPVELAGFEATARGGDAVVLTWQTLSEKGSAGFRLERRREGAAGEGAAGAPGAADAWTALATVASKAPGGTSAEALHYRFTDEALPFEAQALTYRLVQRDLDGTETITAEKTIEVGAPAAFVLHGNFPNPVRSRTTIRYELPERRRVSITVYDVLGRRVRTLVDEEQTGRQEVTFEAGGLSSGTYFYRLSAGDYTETRRLVLLR